jgi:hypothetical protein
MIKHWDSKVLGAYSGLILNECLQVEIQAFRYAILG